jgi:hypothetical protein
MAPFHSNLLDGLYLNMHEGFLAVSQEDRVEFDIMLAYVRRNGLSFQKAHNTLKRKRSIVLDAVLQAGSSFGFAASKMRSGPEPALAVVCKDEVALQYVVPKLRGDRKIVLAAV